MMRMEMLLSLPLGNGYRRATGWWHIDGGR